LLSKRLARAAAPVLGFAGVITAWEIIVRVFDVSPLIVPAPSRIAIEFYKLAGRLAYHAAVTLTEAIAGLIIGATGALAIAVVLTAVPLLRRIFFPLLVATQVVPSVVFAPIVLVWFGYGLQSKIVIAAIICFFPVVVNTAHGLTAVTPELLELANTVGAREARIFLRIRLPNALPYFVTALKPATTLAMIGAVVGEFIGGNAGLGSLIVLYIRFLNMPAMFATVVMLIIVGVGLFLIIEIIGLSSIGWYRKSLRLEKSA
jgi:NitT/TauT family transport system permease protein